MHVSTISFYYGLCAQDIDTVLFIFWSIEYLDKMTKGRAMAIIIGIKIISIVIVSVPSMLLQWSCTVDINCALYSLEALFFQTIPYMIYFLISLLVICYISCKKYRLSKVVVPISIIQQDQSYYVNLLKTIKKYLKLNIWSILLIFLLMPENVARIIILAFNVKCEDTGTYTGFLLSFQTVFTILYPIFINYRLNNYH